MPLQIPTALRAGALPLAATALLLAGCAQTQLRPAPGAQVIPNLRAAAVTEESGVRMVVQSEAWDGRPDNLERELTPLRVTIENRGQQPVRVRYEDFTLDTGEGITYSPLPPLNIQGEVTQRASRPLHAPTYRIVPRFAWYRFHVAPWYAPYYDGLHAWGRPWAFNSFYYDTYYPRWTVELPTADMLRMAIPEGVIDPGGRLSGFLYFPKIDESIGRIHFQAQFTGVNGDDQRLAQLELPFETG